MRSPLGLMSEALRLSVVLGLLLGLGGAGRAEQGRRDDVPRPPSSARSAEARHALAAAATAVSAPDRSELGAGVGTAWLLVIAPNSQRTGLDTASGQELREIPRSYVYQDWMSDKTFSLSVTIERPAEGAYRLIVVAADQKTSELEVYTFASDGSSPPKIPRVRSISGKPARLSSGLSSGRCLARRRAWSASNLEAPRDQRTTNLGTVYGAHESERLSKSCCPGACPAVSRQRVIFCVRPAGRWDRATDFWPAAPSLLPFDAAEVRKWPSLKLRRDPFGQGGYEGKTLGAGDRRAAVPQSVPQCAIMVLRC